MRVCFSLGNVGGLPRLLATFAFVATKPFSITYMDRLLFRFSGARGLSCFAIDGGYISGYGLG